MKVLYICYTGDFAEGYQRLIVNGGKENYYGQLYSVSAVVEQAENGFDIMVLTLDAKEEKIQLAHNLVAVGLGRITGYLESLKNQVLDFNPDFVVLRFPDYSVLSFLRKMGIKTFPVLADSLDGIPLHKVKGRFCRFMLLRELKKESIKWVANHQINASRSLIEMGVPADKVLPYDWEHYDNPSRWTKDIPSNLASKKINIFYAGTISVDKGIFDLISACAYVKKSGRDFVIRVAGRGEIEKLEALATKNDIADKLEMLGLIDHDDVLKNMNHADVVVVPSRHLYPEGLPMTIMESLMVHTPVIASDHPMFVGRVGLRGSVTFFKEKDARGLGEKILSVCSDSDRYKKMSNNARHEWHDLNLDLKWADMINCWINDPEYDFSPHNLEAIS